jgi:hypothetical protein
MCGEEPNIRIEKAGNGYIIDSYTPGTRSKNGEHSPGKHERHVATGGHHVVRLLSKHLLKGKKKSGRKRVAGK